jgi:hypothetical protein
LIDNLRSEVNKFGLRKVSQLLLLKENTIVRAAYGLLVHPGTLSVIEHGLKLPPFGTAS